MIKIVIICLVLLFSVLLIDYILVLLIDIFSKKRVKKMIKYQLHKCKDFYYYIIDSKEMGLCYWFKLNAITSFSAICDIEFLLVKEPMENWQKLSKRIEKIIRSILENGTDCQG